MNEVPWRDPPDLAGRFQGFYGSRFHRVAFTAWGAADSRRVAVCIHGYMQNGRELDPLARALAANGWRAFCPDLAGHGLSGWRDDPGEYRFALYAADVATMIAMTGHPRVDLIGSSMGAIIAMKLAALPGAPIRSLVMSDVGTSAPREAVQHMVGLLPTGATFADRAAAEHSVRRFFSDRGPLPDDQWSRVFDVNLAHSDGRHRYRHDPRLLQAMVQMAERGIDRWADWKLVGVPSLVVRGALSRVLPADVAERMVAGHPAAQLLTIPGAGHPPWLRTPDQIAPIVDWLKRQGE